MELIEKLDIRISITGNRRRWAKFKCSFCFQEVEKELYAGIKYKSCGCVQYKLMAESNTGKKRTEEQKQRMKENRPDFNGEKNPFYNKKHTKEARYKIGIGSKDRIDTEITKLRRSESHKGILLGRTYSKEHRENLSISHTGKIGELASNWQGGKTFEEYGIEFNKELKQQIFERDNCTCQYPGCVEIHKRLHVHHIDYNKRNNNPENLITLGVSCHTKTNGKRQYWTEFYQNIMINRIMECLL